jgi:hypothetical protein
MGFSIGTGGFRLVGTALVLATLAGAAAPSARAADGPTATAASTYTYLEAQIKGHIKDKSLDALKKDVEQVGKAVADEPDAKNRTRLGTLLGLVVNGTTDDAVQKAAIVAIGATKDSALFPCISRFLKQPDLDAEPPLCKAAIEATGKLAADDAVLPLMTLVDKSHVLSLASAAMEAFSLYGTKKNVRRNILRDLVSTVSKDRPGVGQRWDASQGGPAVATAKTRTNELSRQRWDALSGILVSTLNKMTGTQGATAEDWFKLYDDYKGGLDKLFVDPAKS